MTHTDHRMEDAQRSNQGKGRGYGFFPDDPMRDTPMIYRAVEEAFRVRSLVIFAVIAAVISVWWL